MSPSMLTTSVMAVRDYERALAVLGRCADVESVENLQEEFLEALASVYGCIHTAFFQTDSFTLTVADPHPVLNGATVRIINEYRDRWYTEDVMFTPCSLDHIRRSGVSALCQLTRQSIPESGAEYLEAFLFRHGLHSACALDLDLPGGQRGVIGIFHEDADSLGPADLAGFSVIVRSATTARNWPCWPTCRHRAGCRYPGRGPGLPSAFRARGRYVTDRRPASAGLMSSSPSEFPPPATYR
jgi:hypothetical protein